jgi:flagellar hook-associated protein 1 FlgK
MYGLSSAINSALSGILTTSSQTAVVSRNVTRAGEEGYSRKTALVTSDPVGNPRTIGVSRSADLRLTEKANQAQSTVSYEKTLADALLRLSETVGDVEDDGSITWGLGRLQTGLSDFAGDPSSTAFANEAFASARDLAASIRSAADVITEVRGQADAAIGASVQKINTLLASIHELNSSIVAKAPGDPMAAELMDQRDGLVKQLSSEIGVRVINRPDNAIAIFADNGAVLFDVVPRSVTFTPTQPFAATATGNSLRIDGIDVTGPNSPMPLKSGALAAQFQVRDNLASTYSIQMDEIARSLITLFAETDQGVPPSLPAATGLFTYSGSPAVPPSGIHVPGLASELGISAAFDISQGGTPFLLRDGGSNGAAYLENAAGLTGFQGRIDSLLTALEAGFSFAASAQIGSNASIQEFASSSAGWVEGKRQENSRSLNFADAAQQRASEALSRKTGVNIDEEMSILLNLEKSYQASARIMTSVDAMFNSLLEAVR